MYWGKGISQATKTGAKRALFSNHNNTALIKQISLFDIAIIMTNTSIQNEKINMVDPPRHKIKECFTPRWLPKIEYDMTWLNIPSPPHTSNEYFIQIWLGLKIDIIPKKYVCIVRNQSKKTIVIRSQSHFF